MAGGNVNCWKGSFLMRSFNPPPAGWPGETITAFVIGVGVVVSIRPRPDGRGKPVAVDHPVGNGIASIRPRPDGRGKRHSVQAMQRLMNWFQSAPGRMAGGNGAAVWGARR